MVHNSEFRTLHRRRGRGIESLLNRPRAVARHPFRKQVGELSIDALPATVGPRLVAGGRAIGVGQPPRQVDGARAAVAAAVVPQAEDGPALPPGPLLLGRTGRAGGDAPAQGDVGAGGDARAPLVGGLAAGADAGQRGQGVAGNGIAE